MRIEHMRFADTGTCRKSAARKNCVQKEQTPSQVDARGSGWGFAEAARRHEERGTFTIPPH